MRWIHCVRDLLLVFIKIYIYMFDVEHLLLAVIVYINRSLFKSPYSSWPSSIYKHIFSVPGWQRPKSKCIRLCCHHSDIAETARILPYDEINVPKYDCIQIRRGTLHMSKKWYVKKWIYEIIVGKRKRRESELCYSKAIRTNYLTITKWTKKHRLNVCGIFIYILFDNIISRRKLLKLYIFCNYIK